MEQNRPAKPRLTRVSGSAASSCAWPNWAVILAGAAIVVLL